MKKILLTGAGAPGGPGIIKALSKANYFLHVADQNPFASGRFLSHPFVCVPNADDEDFLPFVLAYCKGQEIDVVFPLVTKELFHFAKAKEKFESHGIKLIVSNEHDLQIANDKGRLYQHLLSKKIPVAKFKVVKTFNDLESAAFELGYPAKPVCIKPTVANGSRGVRILKEDADEFNLLFHQKPNHLYTNLDRVRKIVQGMTLPEMLVSEYLPGQEYTVDAIVQDGVPKLILPRSRERMNNGISVQGTFVKNEAIIQYCDQILRSLDLSGPIGLQVKADENGSFRILEINPRIQGTSVAALGAGINLPELAVKQLFEAIKIDEKTIGWGTSFVRYYDELFYRREDL